MNAQRREGKRAPPDPPILADAKGGRRTKIEGKQREPAWDARKVHRERNRGIPRGTERSNKPLKERKKKMAKITMMSGIASISGRVGNCCFRTMKATGKVYMHQMDVRSKKVRRTKEPSEAMMRQRKRFAAITKIVKQMLAEGSKKSRKQLWKIATEAYDAANQ